MSHKQTQTKPSNIKEDAQETGYMESPILTPEQKWTGVRLWIMGWIIPGFAHWMLGQKKKALIFFLMLNGLFIWGMALKGEIVFPVMDIHSNEFNLVNILIFLLGIGNGLMSVVNMIPSFHMGDASVKSYEVATLFMVVSGAMNMFVAFHAWDLYRLNLSGSKKDKSHD